ncbi:hypothetical protein QF027_004618 [Streptomyces canus]|nr:hypothetical protein [Streptomyces canus]
MGLSLGFGFGPIRMSIPLSGGRRRRRPANTDFFGRKIPKPPRRNPTTGLFPGETVGYHHDGCAEMHMTEAQALECVKSKLPPGEKLEFMHDDCTIHHRTPGAAARCYGTNYRR